MEADNVLVMLVPSSHVFCPWLLYVCRIVLFSTPCSLLFHSLHISFLRGLPRVPLYCSTPCRCVFVFCSGVASAEVAKDVDARIDVSTRLLPAALPVLLPWRFWPLPCALPLLTRVWHGI